VLFTSRHFHPTHLTYNSKAQKGAPLRKTQSLLESIFIQMSSTRAYYVKVQITAVESFIVLVHGADDPLLRKEKKVAEKIFIAERIFG
jgi:hypothetical protein